MKDILDQTMLSPKAVEKWHRHCRAFIREAQIPDPRLIPDEQAHLLDNGDLLIFCEVEGYGRCEMRVKADEWKWMDS